MGTIIIQIQLFSMKFGRLNILSYFTLVCFILSCNSREIHGKSSEQDIAKIKIINNTGNQRIPHEIEINDYSTIREILSEITRLRIISYKPNVRASTGIYEVRLVTKSGKSDQYFNVIFTIYDGVIIHGTDESGTFIDKYYKNDKLEMMILQLFLDKKDQN